MTDPAFSIEGKTILITGASSGIGYATAVKCAAAGAKLVLTGRSEEKLKNLITEIGSDEHSVVPADLTIASDLERLVEKTGKLDGLVHSAGVVSIFPIQFLNRKKSDEAFGVNYYAAVELVSLLLKKRKIADGASIIFLSSIAGRHPYKGGAAYAASKAALESFCRSIAIETAPKKIRANAISPAMVKTAIYYDMEKNMEPEAIQKHLADYPLGVGAPEDVANAVIFLLSDASRWITGINLRMDGGLLLES